MAYKVQSYSSDLSDEEWELISPHLKYYNTTRGAKRKYNIREVVNALLYIAVNGSKWSDLPSDFPPYKSVWYYYCKFKRFGIMEKLQELFLKNGKEVVWKGRDSLNGNNRLTKR